MRQTRCSLLVLHHVTEQANKERENIYNIKVENGIIISLRLPAMLKIFLVHLYVTVIINYIKLTSKKP